MDKNPAKAYLETKAGVRLFYAARACNFEHLQPRPQVRTLLRLLEKSAPSKLFDAFQKNNFCSVLQQLRATADDSLDTFPYNFLEGMSCFFSPENAIPDFAWQDSSQKKVLSTHKGKFVAMLKQMVNPANVAVVLVRKALTDKIIELSDDKKV